MKKLILKNGQSPGDILMLTAAVRDLHRCYPNRFKTDVRTSCSELWQNNPLITPLREQDDDVVTIDCHYPIIHESSRRPDHFLSGFSEFLNEELDLKIRATEFRGDVHLSSEERERSSPVAELMGSEVPYWIIVAGGKYDFTIKWWHFRRYQKVVNALGQEVLFVQVGEKGHYHPQLHGTLDLRGKTSLRELIRLVYRAQGVLCPVTFLMHLAAAVPSPSPKDSSRACVVVAGGRESPHWEAYPSHQFIHTVGALPCCLHGGCWRARTLPLGDGHDKDDEKHLCRDVVDGLPHCMDLIEPAEVIQRVRHYFAGGALRAIEPNELRAAQPYVVPSLRGVLS